MTTHVSPHCTVSQQSLFRNRSIRKCVLYIFHLHPE